MLLQKNSEIIDILYDVEGFQRINKSYKGIWEAANMRFWRDIEN